MKRIFLLPLFALLFSCGGTTSKYEKLIADVVQTERGVKTVSYTHLTPADD